LDDGSAARGWGKLTGKSESLRWRLKAGSDWVWLILIIIKFIQRNTVVTSELLAAGWSNVQWYDFQKIVLLNKTQK